MLTLKQHEKAVEYVYRKAEFRSGLAEKPKRPKWLKRKDEEVVTQRLLAYLLREGEIVSEVLDAWDENDRPRGLDLG